MIRWIAGLAAVAVVVVAVAAWATSKPVEVDRQRGPDDVKRPRNEGGNGERPPNNDLKTQVVLGPTKASSTELPSAVVTDSLVIPDLRATLRYSQEVPSPRQGTLRMLATEVKEGEVVPEDRKLVRAVPILVRPLKASEQVPAKTFKLKDSERVWRQWNDGDDIEPGAIQIVYESRTFRELREGDIVRGDDFLGVIDVELSVAELSIKVVSLTASEAKREAAIKTRDEAYTRWQADLEARKRVEGSVSLQEVRASELTYHRYGAEVIAGQQDVKKAAAELRQAYLVLKQHVLRVDPRIRVGKVKTIYKKEGEAVKEQESVLVIQNHEDLQVEGLIEIQQSKRLRVGQKVFVEAPVQKAPVREMPGHRDEVLAVAVSKGESPWVISASADRTVRVVRVKQDSTASAPRGETGAGWVFDRDKKVWWLDHTAVVRALACSPKAAKENLLLTGAADGSARLWDLDRLDAESRSLSTKHKSGINVVGFSADGTWCATGGEDNAICICNVASGDLSDLKLDAHRGAVTSLGFTPDNKLVTAGRGDSVVIVWNFANGKLTKEREIRGRVGTVDQVGVSPDGKTLLFDQGKELRVLSTVDATVQGVIQNSTGAANFSTLALFAPNGKTVVTVGAADNRLQLWRNPVQGRPSELRQYMWTSGQTTCAAFDPDARIMVTGTQDKQVLIWGLPTDKDLEESKEPNATVSLIDESLDSGSRQVKVRAIVDKDRKPEGLIPGATATMIANPTK